MVKSIMAFAILCLVAVSALLFANTNISQADDVFRIEIGKDYKRYSNADLQRRVWELERAVYQLQNRVFQLEGRPAAAATPPPESWVCNIEAAGDTFSAAGATKALATAKVIKQCKDQNDGEGFFCKNVKCQQ
jgi:hypothetical protein